MCEMGPAVLLWLLATCLLVDAFYLPSLAPTNFCEERVSLESRGKCKSKVYVHVNKLDSMESLIPYEYSSFDFCEPGEYSKDRDPVENLGQVVFGERLRASGYQIDFPKTVEETKLLCYRNYTKKHGSKKLEFLYDRIHENYMHQWVIDNMPVTWCYNIVESKEPYCTTRFPVGCYVTAEGVRQDACYLSNQFTGKDTTYIFNHVHLILSYHEGTVNNGRTVDFLLRARVQLASCDSFPCSENSKPMVIPKPGKLHGGKTLRIPYTYTVAFETLTTIRWASRWNYILSSLPQSNVQLVSVCSPVILTLLLLLPFLRFCSKHDGSLDNWKLLHGDVFRSPRNTMLLSVGAGAGMQLLFTTDFVLLVGCYGFLCPPNRGALTTAILIFYVFFGSVAGFVSAHLYKMMGGLHWKRNVLMSSLLVPGIVFGVFFFLNLLLWGAESSAAVPYTTILTLLSLWFGISLPLTFLGAFFGFGYHRKSPGPDSAVVEGPVVAETPREIPHSIRCPSVLIYLLGGFLPFGAISVQVFFISNNIWNGQMYYQFGIILVAFFLFIILCAETSILICHFFLCSEDYRWWWRAFLSTASSGFYLFLFFLYFFVYKTTFTGFLSYILYFGYTFLAVLLFTLMSGSIGFISCLLFVRKIYATIPTSNQE